MSYEAEGNAIQERFADEWVDGDGEPLTLIAWENVPFTVPGSSEAAPAKQEWVRFRVLGNESNVASVGGPVVRFRHGGEVVIEIFTLPNTGPQRARELADTACSIFRAWRVGGLLFFSPRVIDVGNEDGWYRKNVIAPFQRDTAFTVE